MTGVFFRYILIQEMGAAVILDGSLDVQLEMLIDTEIVYKRGHGDDAETNSRTRNA